MVRIMEKNRIDIKENFIFKLDNELLEILLKDRSSKKNIIWATDNYSHKGFGYQSSDEITVVTITGHNGSVIKPRTEKSQKEQITRIRYKAEVFTPSWVCNKQNTSQPTTIDQSYINAEHFLQMQGAKIITETIKNYGLRLSKDEVEIVKSLIDARE